jgi:hypothetical protein
MRKLSLFVIFAIIVQSSFAQVKEYWEASFTPSLKGNYRYSQEGSLLIVGINIEKNSEGLFTGKLEFAGPVRCRGVTKIESGALLGDTVIFKTEPLPPVQCPSVTFSGKVVGDTWVGILPWNGKDNEVAFKKK